MYSSAIDNSNLEQVFSWIIIAVEYTYFLLTNHRSGETKMTKKVYLYKSMEIIIKSMKINPTKIYHILFKSLLRFILNQSSIQANQILKKQRQQSSATSSWNHKRIEQNLKWFKWFEPLTASITTIFIIKHT